MTARRPTYVLDAFAVLALFRDEPGADAVEDLIRRARQGDALLAMSVVNLGEVVYRTIRKRGVEAAADALARIGELPVEAVEVDRALATDAAYLKGRHRISYADCVAAALARRLGGTLVTGDPDFRVFETLLTIEWLPTG